jgi:hypothetical protein
MIRIVLKGGAGSGDHGHAGRPGLVGGSASGPQVNTTNPDIGKGWEDLSDLRAIAKLSNIRDRENRALSALETLRDYGAEAKLLDYDLDTYVPSDNYGDADFTEDIGGLSWQDASVEVREIAKDNIVTALSEKSGLDYDLSNSIVAQWAATSNGYSYASMSLQQAASEEFGMEMSAWQELNFDRIATKNKAYAAFKDILAASGEEFDQKANGWQTFVEVRKLVPGAQASWLLTFVKAEAIERKMKAGEEVADDVAVNSFTHNDFLPLTDRQTERKALRTMYEHTQETLGNKGYGPDSEITVYRGYSNDKEPYAPSDIGNKVVYRGNVMESWSLSPEVASEFGNIIIGTKVKARNVLSTARTGFGCLTEGELVILGNSRIEATLIYTNPEVV